MSAYLDTILVLDHQPRTRSRCAEALDELSYTHVLYRDYSDPSPLAWEEDEIDAVVAVWTDIDIERKHLLLSLMGIGTRTRGVLVVSQFSTPENAEVLRTAGARAWVRFPFAVHEFGSRLRYLLEGERRRAAQAVSNDRRREPVFPLPVATWSNGSLILPGGP